MTALLRPAPVPAKPARPVPPDAPGDAIAARLLEGERLQLGSAWAQGVAALDALHRRLGPPPADHAGRRAARRTWEEAADRLIVHVRRHGVPLADAPPIGFLAELYPETDLHLSMRALADLAEAWWRYDEGLQLAVLGRRIHPYYGTYFPRRHLHLELFATWLAGYAGPTALAADVGTGSGVLALLLARKGFARVVASDVSPNAVESVKREIARSTPRPPVEPRLTDLLTGLPTGLDLVVFNPPWTFGPVQSTLDQALQFDPATFARFFDQAHAHLGPHGRVVLVYSNLVRLVTPDEPHPIEAELARGRFEQVQLLQRRVKPTDGRRTRERVEVWELARAR